MSRPLRIQFEDAIYHVLSRGNGGESVFPDPPAKTAYLECLVRARERFGLTIHAYCLMTNHSHLLLQTSRPNLSAAMQWLNLVYSIRYNRQKGRNGHVFQGRYRALLVQGGVNFLAVSRYIALNPVKAGMVPRPRDYPWSGYAFLAGYQAGPPWLETGLTLGSLSPDRVAAIQLYRQLVEEGAEEDPGLARRLEGGADHDLAVGGGGFLEEIARTRLSGKRPVPDVPASRILKPVVGMEEILALVENLFAVSRGEILRPWGRPGPARRAALFLARERSGLSNREIGCLFGVSGSLVAVQARKFREEMRRDAGLRERIAELTFSVADNSKF